MSKQRSRQRAYRIPKGLRTCFTQAGKAKTKYATVDAAKAAADLHRKRAYWCQWCDAYHIGG